MENKIKRIGFSLDDREKILEKTNFKCAHCGKPLDKYDMTVEHIVPVSKGGTNDEFNITALCTDCNTNKSNWTYSDIGTYYKYIDEKYIKQYAIEHDKQLERIDCDRLFKSNSQIFKMGTHQGYKIMYQMMRRNKKNRKKALNFLTQSLITMRLDVAYPGEAKDILEFLNKLKRKGHNISKSDLYPNETCLAEVIKAGEAYILRNPSNEICGIIVLESVENLSENLPQLENILYTSNKDAKYIITLCEINYYASSLFERIMNSIVANCVNQGHYPIYANILQEVYRYDDKMLRLPYNLNGRTVTLEILTLDGLRRHFSNIYNRVIDEDSDVTVEQMISYTLGFKDELDTDLYEYINKNVAELGLIRFIYGERIGDA